MKKKAIKIATASAIAASGFVAVAPTQSEAAPNVKAEVSRAKTVMYNAMYAYSKPFVATGEMVDQAVVYAAYKKGEAQYKYAVSVVNKYAPAKEKAALLADLDKVRKNYLLGRALNYIKAFNALELHVEKAAKELEAALATNDEAKIKEAKANLEKVYEAQKADLNKVVESSIKAHVNELAATVVETAKAAAEKKLEEIAVPKVVEVSAINATQVVVKFNKEVDETDAETVARYSINNANPTTAELGSDKKSVTLTFANANQVEVTNAVLVVEPVKLAADTDKTTEKYTKVFTYEDTVKPEIASVEAKTNGTVATSLTVKASEPIQSALAKVEGTYYSVNFGGTDTATITGLSLEVNKSHTLELINLTDKSGNVTVSTSKTFNVTVDTVAPTVSLAPKGDKQILVTFSKPMDVNTVAAAFQANTAVKDETLNTVNHAAVTSAVAGSNNTQFLITINSTLYSNKNTRTLTVVFPNTIKDKLGNAIAAGTQTVTLTKDTAKPVPTGYKVVKNANGEVTAIEVTFSEGLAVNANPAEPTIVNMNGVNVTSTFLGGLTANAINAGDKNVTFTANTPAKLSGQYAFSFGAGLVTDQAETGNTSDAFNYTIDFGTGATTFSLPSGSLPTATNNVITVEFGRPVKGGAVANSATDVANYTLGGKPLPQGTTIVLDPAQDTATITLPAGSITKSDANAVFTVANVMSLNGEMLNTYTGTLAVVDNVKPVLNSSTLNVDGTVTVGFDETLAVAPDADDLKVTVNGVDLATTAYTVTPVTAGADAGKYLVTVNGLVADGGDGQPGGDDILYVDVNGNGAYNAGTDIVVTTGTVTAGAVSLKNAAFTSVKVGTVASPNTGKDADNNYLKGDVVLTVK